MRRTASKPAVRAAMKSRSIKPSRMAMWSSPLASAASVPGVSCRCSCAAAAVAVARGSATISLPPRAPLLLEILHDRRHRLGGVGANQQDRFGPRDVLEREGQAAIDAEGAQAGGGGRGHAEAARCSRCSRCARRRARICRGGRPSRWSARRRRRRRRRRGPCARGSRGMPATIRSSASSQLARPERFAAVVVAHQRRPSAGPARRSSAAAVQPLRQSPPLLVGKSRPVTCQRRPARARASCRIAGRNRGNASSTPAGEQGRASGHGTADPRGGEAPRNPRWCASAASRWSTRREPAPRAQRRPAGRPDSCR